MKHLIIFGLACIGLMGSLKSQEYIPIAVEGPHWIIAYDDVGTPPLVDDLWEYYAFGDTCIGNECYKKVYRRELVTSYDPPPFMPDGEYELFGFIRDDSINKIVYATLIDDYGECLSGEEFILFDFSAEIGDTVTSCLIPQFVDFIVNSITPQNYLGFDTRVFAWYEGWDEYYEGLGSHYGLFEVMFAPYKSGNSKYILYTYLYYYCRESPCDLVVDLPEYQFEEHKMNIHPNPFTTSTIIEYELTEPSNVQLTMYNTIGETIQVAVDRLMPVGKHTFTWSPERLPEGMYYGVLRSEEGVSVVKMVKQ